MRPVQDLLFLDELDFTITLEQGFRCQHTTGTWGEAAKAACDLVGIELVDYHTCVLTPSSNGADMHIQLRSKAWRERTERLGRAIHG